MSSSDASRNGLAAAYGILYSSTILWAMLTGGGASGGMAFVLPVILGLPWSLLLAVLLFVPSVPRVVMILLLLVVPPALSVFPILRAGDSIEPLAI